MKKHFIFSILFALTALAASAYTPTPLFAKKVNLRAGCTVLLELAESLSSEQMTIGQMVKFKVTTDVLVDGSIVIRTGALAWGRVKSVSPATFNQPAEIRIEVRSVQAVDGQQIALDGNEQTLKGARSNQGIAAGTGSAISATVMNDVEINTK